MSASAQTAVRGRRPIGRAGALLALPVIGLVVLLAQPQLDLQWEHHPSHFWLVLATATINVVLATLTHALAARHRDARLLMVSLAFLASAGFLGLHALATPGVLLSHPNTGFTVATPVGLMLASVFAALSVAPVAGPRAAIVLRYRRVLLVALLLVMGGWGFVSLADLPPLQGRPPQGEAIGLFNALAVASVALFGYAAWRYVGLHRRRGGDVTLATAVAFVLLGEAMLAVILSRNWHLSWWEWHLLMLAAFLSIAVGARNEYRRGGTLAAAFGGLYLGATLERLDRWHARAIEEVAAADARGESPDAVLRALRREGASETELALLEQAAGEINRLDQLFRPFLPSHMATRMRTEPALARLGGEQREVTALFADLAGFTTFSETRSPTEVIAMLNQYWAVVVPAIDTSGGVVEQFAGDGVVVTFNVAGDQPDHAPRAARAGLEIVAAARRVAGSHPGWPLFRVGVNSGAAVVGNVGAAGRRSFAVIGDTSNTAARLMAAGAPGDVTVAKATWDRLGPAKDGVSLGAIRVKGRQMPVEAWILRSMG
jgi:class 3 adenylate cyclase